MRQAIGKGMLATAAAATSILSLSGSTAFAVDGSAVAAGSPGILSGNSVQAPVEVPLNACGNSANVVGAANPTFGNSCANPGSAPRKHASAEHASAPQRAAAPKRVAPKRVAPKQAAPEQAAPKQAAPKQAAPERVAPKQAAPKQAAPEQAAPKQAAPKQAAPEQAAPKQAAPKHAAPKQAAPEHAAPKQTAPKQAAPKHAAPKQAPQKHAPPKRAATKADNGPGYGQDTDTRSDANAGTHSLAESDALQSPGILAGNDAQAPADVPVNACGNTVDVIGLLNPVMGNNCANGTHAPTPPQHETPPSHETPPTPPRAAEPPSDRAVPQPRQPGHPGHPGQPPRHVASSTARQMPSADLAAPHASARLAETGSDQDLLAATAASAALLLGGGILYRRGRASSGR
ncbi:chaplin family protein [Streptomyces sp. NPDC056486]|uniref:chaplin n=1 Tax=Streptomyces sp. NPDC056486 TaxID=3345835 RepID=UPI0036CE6CF5